MIMTTMTTTNNLFTFYRVLQHISLACYAEQYISCSWIVAMYRILAPAPAGPASRVRIAVEVRGVEPPQFSA